MITLVNYGLGNIKAFANIYKRLNIETRIASTKAELEGARRIILPGVGAFDWAMDRLNASGMRDCLDDLVLNQGASVIGVCVGMQIMAARSDEGEAAGLGWFDAEIRRLDTRGTSEKLHMPHMGWNDVAPVEAGGLFEGIEAPRFYFLHSYYFSPAKSEQTLAETDYEGRFTSAVRSGRIFGVQFHPEKSHHWGVRLLKNFAEMET